MPEPLVISIPHHLDRAEARRRIGEGVERLRPELAQYVSRLDVEWHGDRLDFRARAMAQTITGRLDVLDQAIRLEIDLPWVLRLLARSITRQVRGRGQQLLDKPRET